jgi:hypothetical protein
MQNYQVRELWNRLPSHMNAIRLGEPFADFFNVLRVCSTTAHALLIEGVK